MQTLRSISTLLLLYLSTRVRQASAQFHNHNSQAHQALFIRDIDGPSPYSDQQHFEHTSDRIPRQSTGGATLNSMDQTVQGILEWLQGKYANARKARQETPSRQYLPSRVNPTTTQKPRPFQTNSNANGIDFRSFPNGGGVQPTGYPYPSSPNPTFNIPDKSYSSSPNPSPYSPVSSTSPPYSPSSTPSQTPNYNPPSQSPSYNPPSQSPSYNAPSQSPSYNPPSQSPTYNPPSQSPSYNPPSQSPSVYGPSSQPTGETGPSQVPLIPSTGETSFSSTGVGFPSSGPGIAPTGPSSPGIFPPVDNNIDTDENHPPHIHEINVQCAKDMMIIDIEFNRPFNGIIYSKGHYNNPDCRYVSPNSNQIKYSVTVQLNSCGTQFVDQFSEGKQAYLENVLVLQNEPGIQEVGVEPVLLPVWDTIRSVRCLWEGNLNKALSVALSVGMLNQEIVTFSGDTASAKLDIQMGRGPFAAAATGLVKIGETMTLVVTVEGDPGFNVLVRQCVARDNDPNSGNLVQLTDNLGCVLKPKLMGAFQTTRNPDTNSVIAYAFFQAFKFPDVMDLTIECNVELCKTECSPCSDPDQKLEPGRRRRSIDNSTLELTDPVVVGRRLRVILPEDLEDSRQSPAMLISVGTPVVNLDAVCLSSSVFLFSSTVLLSILAASCVCSAALWLRMQHLSLHK